jgi:septin family protein
MDLTIIDTPGYDSIDNTHRMNCIVRYIEDRFDEQLGKSASKDVRIHCCFYFIAAHR